MNKRVEKNRKVRGLSARRYIHATLDNPEDPLYTASDTKLAKILHVTRLTVINIRKEMNIENRNCRLVKLLQNTDTVNFTIRELAEKLDLKYPCLYRLLRDLKLKTRADRKPIDCMLESRRRRVENISIR